MRKFTTWVFVFLLLGIGLLSTLSEWNSPGRGAVGSPPVKTHFNVQLSTGKAHIDVYIGATRGISSEYEVKRALAALK